MILSQSKGLQILVIAAIAGMVLIVIYKTRRGITASYPERA